MVVESNGMEGSHIYRERWVATSFGKNTRG